MSLLRVVVRARRMLVRLFAVLVSRGRVLLRLFVFANLVMVGSLMVMMRGGVMMMLARGMFRRLSHL